jgi:hypothetical protein
VGSRESPGTSAALAARPLPVVLTREEVRKVLGELQGVERLVLTLLYGTGFFDG